jgi:hypothetical protein
MSVCVCVPRVLCQLLLPSHILCCCCCSYLAHGTGTDYMYEMLHVPMSFTWEIYGDESASFEDCFRMFNPVTRDEFERVTAIWLRALFQLIELLPSHPATWPLLRGAVSTEQPPQELRSAAEGGGHKQQPAAAAAVVSAAEKQQQQQQGGTADAGTTADGADTLGGDDSQHAATIVPPSSAQQGVWTAAFAASRARLVPLLLSLAGLGVLMCIVTRCVLLRHMTPCLRLLLYSWRHVAPGHRFDVFLHVAFWQL